MIAQYERELRARVGSLGEIAPGIDGPAAQAFHEFIINEYRPPADKALLVFLQCSVRRA
jgi:hypothetical protein